MPIIIYKKEGDTPLLAMENFLKGKEEFLGVKKTYAGRLDPMAEGLLIVLSGGECLKKEEYLNLKKTYVFEVLLGVSTDTEDILGVVEDTNNNIFNIESFDFDKLLANLLGESFEKYPMYSSKTFLGKPLFVWARENKENEIEIPEHKINIYNINLENKKQIKSEELLFSIKERIARVKGDFRQDLILEKWEEFLNKESGVIFNILSFEAEVSSGTYIRVLSQRIGKFFNLPALAYSIKRIKIGDFGLNDVDAN